MLFALILSYSFSRSFASFFGNRWSLSILLHLIRVSFSASASLLLFFVFVVVVVLIASKTIRKVFPQFQARYIPWTNISVICIGKQRMKETKVVSRDINALFALRTLENNNAYLERCKMQKKKDETHTGAFDNEIIRVLCLFVLCFSNALSHTPLRIKFGASGRTSNYKSVLFDSQMEWN